ncbi:lipoprotein, putative [Altererythrobacter epoxidivorans]|uniref:Lipoprotein, putative n=1 Tax=Altererythrobacter epoxidivorans TaxID=361183 RepID=A0A0M4LU39_9SPHN|nr:TraB/GumN family protein [Altererythrobacter epoxidivorans]ALE16404.1 lipoprotein, putative [Altererythrobacter epoxidivorans]
MIHRLALMLAVLLCLGACQDEPGGGYTGGASPILFEVADADGETKAWLFGTIHSLPDDTEWRTDKLDEAIGNADSLIVEIAALEDSAALFDIYRRLSVTPGQPDIGLKVTADRRPALFSLIDEAGYRPRDFQSLETWAVALNLAQVFDTGEPENGADRAMIHAFKGRPIHEFEGVEKQLGIFDQLPEKEQQDLLAAVVEEADTRSADPARLQRAWLSGDIKVLEEATTEGMLADPELRQALLVDRNRDWLSQLIKRLDQGQRPLVAVGAAHLVGPDGLPALLERQGYTVSRVQ